MEIYFKKFKRNTRLDKEYVYALELRKNLPKDDIELSEEFNDSEGFLLQKELRKR